MSGHMAQKVDEKGNLALHYACNEGHREITWMLLRRDPNLALQYNNNGYTPLHLAAIHGDVSVLEEFARKAPASFQYLTKEEESVFHLAVRYGKFEALVFLVHFSNTTNLLHCQDRYGNTVLHLAVSGGRNQVRIKLDYDIFKRAFLYSAKFILYFVLVLDCRVLDQQNKGGDQHPKL